MTKTKGVIYEYEFYTSFFKSTSSAISLAISVSSFLKLKFKTYLEIRIILKALHKSKNNKTKKHWPNPSQGRIIVERTEKNPIFQME